MQADVGFPHINNRRRTWRYRHIPLMVVPAAVMYLVWYMHTPEGAKYDELQVQSSTMGDFSQESCVIPLPVPFRATLPLQFPGQRDKGRTKVTDIVHFVHGYKQDSDVFNFVNFVAIASAKAVLQPEAIYLHCLQEPTGFFWELVKPHVTLVQGRLVTEVFGKPVESYAHKADLVRLEALLEYGGIYLDIDVMTLRPFDDLMNNDMCMGEEGENGRVGLCNAVMVASSDSVFLSRWYESYRTFNSSEWNHHSVLLPKELARENPTLITQLSYKTFHWPLWDEAGMQLMFGSFDYDYKENRAVHIWSHGVKRSIFSNFSMTWCFECQSTLLSMMRYYVPDPLFSVIMPCYNQSKYLEEALRSVGMQTFPSWEIIVIDDRSPDNCGEMAQSFAARGGLGMQNRKRLRVLVSPENQGLAASRNFGIKEARGVWICALDADDQIEPNYFHEAVNAMSNHPSVELIYSDQQFFQDSSWVWDVPLFDTAGALGHGPLPVMSLYLRSLWFKVGGYSSALPWGNEDYDFWLRLLELGVNFQKLPGLLVLYRYKKDSMMRTSDLFAKEEGAMLITRHLGLHHHAKVLRAHRPIMNMTNETRLKLLNMLALRRLSRKDKAYISFWLGLAAKHNGSVEEARRRFQAASGIQDLQWQPLLYEALCTCQLEGRRASASLFEALITNFPGLNKTTEFQRYDANCRTSVNWATPAKRISGPDSQY